MIFSVSRTSRGRFVAAATALVGFAVHAGPVKAAQFEFKCGSQQPAEHPSCVRLAQMWTTVSKESAGRVHVEFLPNSVLGTDPAMLAQLRLGALQFLSTSPGALGAVVPMADVSNLGYAFQNLAEAARVMDGPLGAYLRDDAATRGIHVLRSFWGSGMFQIGSNSHPIHTPEDLRNFKVKVVGKISIDLMKSFGASPTPVSLVELYSALQTKLVDGEAAPLGTMETSKLFEVNKYVSMTNHAYSGQWVIANAGLWANLPPDLQGIIERNATKYAIIERRDTELVASSCRDKLARQGLVFNDVDRAPFRALLRPYYETWSKEFGPKVWGLLQSGLGHTLA
jgi:tripartite ATP-independent transporter DctP family solute receptor